MFTCSIIVVLLAARWALDASKSGDFLPMNVVALSLGFGPALAVFVAAIVRSRAGGASQPGDGIVPSRPQSVPGRAIPVVARMKSGDLGLGFSFGWLWIEEGMLCFRGEAFDFLLSRDDLRAKRGKPIRAGFPFFLNVPKGLSQNCLSLLPGYPVGGRTIPAPKLWKPIEGALVEFEQSQAAREGLFPPVVSGFEDVDSWRFFKTFALIGVYVFFVLLVMPLIVPMPTHLHPVALAGIGASLVPLMGCLGYVVKLQRVGRERAIEKLRSR